jgi:hypothetical protein
MRAIKGLSIFAICLLTLFGCTTSTTTGDNIVSTQQRIQQVTTAVCVPLQTVLTTLSSPGILSTTDQDNMKLIMPMVTSICTMGQNVNITDLQSFNSQGMPALLSILNASPLKEKDKQIATLSVIIAQGVLSGFIAAHPSIPVTATVTNTKSITMNTPADAPTIQKPFIIVPNGVTIQQSSDLKLVNKISN